MKATSRTVFSFLLIAVISILLQANVLYAGNLKRVLAPMKDALALFSPNSLAPEMPREATFEDEVNSIDEQTLINLYPSVPSEADFNDEVLAPDLNTNTYIHSKPLPAINADSKKSPETKTFHKILKSLLVAPDFTLNDKEDNVEFYVTFMLSSDGKITIKDINAPSKRLEDYVKSKLSAFVVDDPANIHTQTYKVKICFVNS